MSYVKTTWVTGDIVTAPKLNNLESGVEANDLNKLNKPSGNGTAGQLLISNGDGSTSWTDTDTTLEESGKAADAKAVGDALGEIDEALETKAEIDGYYEEMTVGDAEQLVSTVYVEESTPYLYRTTGGSADVGNREYLDKLVGASVAWNQLINPSKDRTHAGITASHDANGLVTLSGTATGTSSQCFGNTNPVTLNHVYLSTWIIVTNPNNLSFRIGLLNKITAQVVGADYVIGKGNDTANAAFGVAGFTVDTDFTGVTLYANILDLTAAFGTTIADYVYSLEQATAGSGVAWLKQYINLDTYHPYDAGTMKHVEDLQSHDTVGFNQWDEKWELGYYTSTGEKAPSSSNIRNTNKIPVLAETVYYVKTSYAHGLRFYALDANEAVISDLGYLKDKTFNTPSGCCYLVFYTNAADNVTTYNHDICINLSWSGYRNGEYEPYEKHSYALDSSVVLRGVPTLVDGQMVYDGDEYLPSGVINRQYKLVNLGDLAWEYVDGATGIKYFRSDAISDVKAPSANTSSIKGICGKYAVIPAYDVYLGTSGVGIDTIKKVRIYDANYSDAATFTTAMSGVYLVYELATPTTETADPYTQVQICDDFGTEQFVTTSIIPVGTATRYPANLRDKLQHLPSLAETDGTYLIQQTNKEMSLVPFSGYVTEESLTETLEDYAKTDGYYEGMTVGNAEELVTGLTEEESVPFIFRTSGGSLEIGAREEMTVTGGSLAWNQLLKDISNVGGTGWRPYNANSGAITYENGELIYTISTVGNDPWPNTIRSSQFEKILDHKYLVSYDIYTPHEGFATAAYFNGYVSARVQVGWNTIQTVQNATATSTTAENYFGIAYAGNANYEAGETYKIKNPMFIDLTQMFGTTIADYIYNLEQTTAGAGIAWFKKLFPKDYYPYQAPDLVHVNASEFKTIGFNQFNKSTATDGKYINASKQEITASPYGHSAVIPVIPGMQYYTTGYAGSGFYAILALDAQQNPITWYGGASKTQPFYATLPSNCYYVILNYYLEQKDSVCFSIRWDNTRDGEYEPYTEHSYSLDSSLVLRGIPKIDTDGNLYYDGDTYEADGTVTRRYGTVDLGTLNWAYSTRGCFYVRFDNSAERSNHTVNTYANIICSKYPTCTNKQGYDCTLDKVISIAFWNGAPMLSVTDSSYGTDSSAFKTAMNGVYLVYESAAPTTETADPYQTPQIVDNWGTEEFVVTTQNGVEVPVGHSTIYPISLRDKLEAAPDLPADDGDYILRMSGNEASYARLASEFPAVPTSTDGVFVLKATVTNGTATLTWEAQS